MFGSDLNQIMRKVASSLEIPVVAVLLVLTAAAVFLAGSVIVEAFTHKKALRAARERIRGEVSNTDPERRETIAVRLLRSEKTKRERIVKISDLLSKLGPMFGLLGTLIPLGPGIIALGRGDTFTLSNSLLVAFDTTILGLISAAVTLVVSTVRKRWYSAHYMELESELEDFLDEKQV